jgi:hypothetical protein
MQVEPVFLGVYVKEGAGSSENRWYAWGLPDGKFMLQEIDQEHSQHNRAGFNGKIEKNTQRLEADVFFEEYRVFSSSSSNKQPDFPQKHHQKHNQSPVASSPVVSVDKYEVNSRIKQEQTVADKKVNRQGTVDTNSTDFIQLWQTPGSKVTDLPKHEDVLTAEADKPPAQSEKFESYVNFYNDKYQDGDDGKDKKYAIIKGKREKTSPYQVSQPENLEKGEIKAESQMNAEEIAAIEEQFRTEFSMSLIRLKSKRTEALQSLDNLLKNKGPFSEEHKFMFTDCALALRKRNLYVLAKQFHQKARELSPEDEHILFNLARVMYEAGKIDKAREYLHLSLQMSPDFEEGKNFLAFIESDMV